jgi:ribonuclease BN (tRNA processing enzyme)
MKSAHVDRNAISVIATTHFHADHFDGIPFFMLDAQFFSRRCTPLTIVGPAGLSVWYERVMETAFPGSSETPPKFELRLVEIRPGRPLCVEDLEIHAFQVKHGPAADGPFVAYRIIAGEKIIAYTGDTEWTDSLVEAGRHADLFIAEAYFRSKDVKYHLSLRNLEEHLTEIAPKRLILSHMSDDMLGVLPDAGWETAHDGLELVL